MSARQPAIKPDARLIASLLLVLMALLNFMHIAIPALPLWWSGVCAWLALGLLLVCLPVRMFGQFMGLALVGGLLLLWSSLQYGQSLALPPLLEQNNGVLVMLFSVSFLRLVAVPEQQRLPLPLGRWAFLQTLFGVHVLGAIINLSILVLVAGRYQAKQVLNRQTVTLIGRAFSAAALWSPFFAAMGVTLTYAPGANLLTTMLLGSVLTGVSLGLIILLAGGWRLHGLDDFPGYPMQAGSLLVPVGLAVTVLVLHQWLPAVQVLTLVSMTSVLMVLLALVLRADPAGWGAIQQHVLGAAPRMARELSLFLGAGVLTVGLQSVLAGLDGWQPFQTFAGMEAALLLAAAILVSMIGVHPVISIAVTGPLLLPLHPDLNMLAVLFLSMWSLGVVASPFSGVNVMLRGQFDLAGRDLFVWNIGYVLIMWVLVSLAFVLYAGW